MIVIIYPRGLKGVIPQLFAFYPSDNPVTCANMSRVLLNRYRDQESPHRRVLPYATETQITTETRLRLFAARLLCCHRLYAKQIVFIRCD